jgi:hypothetical protein
MATFTHALYIDESGNGSNEKGINRYWISTAVAVAFDQTATVDLGVKNILINYFRIGELELKATSIPHRLNPPSTSAMVANDVAALLDKVEAHVWVTGTHSGVNVPPGVKIGSPMAKEIARQLLFERVNGFLLNGYCKPGHFLTVWDISNQQELQEFSKSVADFRNAFTKTPLCPRLAPAILGGLSHDWSGLQIADMISHYALHHVGVVDGIALDARKDKSDDFLRYFKPRLQTDMMGNCVGWKIW